MNLTVRSYNGKSQGRVNPKQAGKSLKKNFKWFVLYNTEEPQTHKSDCEM